MSDENWMNMRTLRERSPPPLVILRRPSMAEGEDADALFCGLEPEAGHGVPVTR